MTTIETVTARAGRRQCARHAPRNTVPHLAPERWAAANRHLVRKALAEFLHERILEPQRLGSRR